MALTTDDVCCSDSKTWLSKDFGINYVCLFSPCIKISKKLYELPTSFRKKVIFIYLSSHGTDLKIVKHKEGSIQEGKK